jgi:glycosyltransferase involved in cell wall biosynthesis
MRIAVVDTQTLFASGPLDWLADRLCEALQQHGHPTELVRIPFCHTPPELVVDQMLAVRLMRLENVDRAIALSFPACFLPHDDKVVWLLRQFRQAYERLGAPRQELPNTALGRSVRSAVHAADRAYLAEATRIHTPSAVASRQLSHRSGLTSDVLYPPLRNPDSYRCDEYGDYLLFLGRITADAGQRVAVAAMSLAQSQARLVLAGPLDSGDDLSALRELARELGVENRVEFIPERIGDAERVALLASARAVLWLPCGEDACVQVALEAFQSHKPVIVFADAGQDVELVCDELSGRVSASVAELAAAVDVLTGDAALAKRYGDAAFHQLEDSDISWETVVRELTR